MSLYLQEPTLEQYEARQRFLASPERALRNLSDALSARLSAEDTELACISAARRCGATWADIGEVYGVSRQAAHERWARRVE